MNNGWVSHFRLSRVAFLCGLLLTLGGCGDSSVSSNTIDTDTYLFYTPNDPYIAFINPGGTDLFGLMAVDPAYPSAPIKGVGFDGTTLNSPFLPLTIQAGTVNSSAGTIDDLHYRYVIHSDGTYLYRTSAIKSEGLSHAQISTESAVYTGAANICNTTSTQTFTWVVTDYANPLDSVFLYRKDPDNSTDCSNTTTSDTLYAVQLKDDSSTPPNSISIPTTSPVVEPIAPVYNSDGSINSILMYTSGIQYLRQYTVDLAFVRNLATGLTGKPRVLGIDAQGRLLLLITNGSGDNIYAYDPASPTALSSSLFNTTAGSIASSFASDGTYAYFHTLRTVYRVPFDASASASIVADETGTFTGEIRAATSSATDLRDLRLSGNRLIYIFDDSATYGGGTDQVYARSVPRSGGKPSTIYTFAADTSMFTWRTAAGRVYLTDGSNGNAISISDTGGSSKVYSQSMWMGFTFKSSARLFADSSVDKLARLRDLVPKSIFRLDLSSGGSGGKLISYDADTTAELIDFGVPAPTFSLYGGLALPDMLGLATRDRTLIAYNNTDTDGDDILYLHARNKSTMTVVSRDNTARAVLVGVNYGGGCSFGNGRFDPLLPALILLSAVYIWRRRKSWRTNQ
jgi:hypothetical protein